MTFPSAQYRRFAPRVALVVALLLTWNGDPTTPRAAEIPDEEAAANPTDRNEALLQILRQAMTNEAVLNATGPIVIPPQSSPSPAAPVDELVVTPDPEPAAEPPSPSPTPTSATTPAFPPASVSPAPRRAGAPVVPSFPPPNAAQPRTGLATPGPTATPPGLGQPAGALTPPRNSSPGAAQIPYIYALNAAPLVQVFEEYAKLTGRTVLHPANIQGTVTLSTTGNLTREEAIQALQGALALNGITLIPQGEKFVKAVPLADSLQEGGAIIIRDAEEVPDTEEYVTQVIQLKVALPSEVGQLLESFAKTPNGIVPIDSSMILVVRDYASNVKRMLELVQRIDVEPETEYNLEVIPVKYGRVTDLFDTMSSLISGSEPGSYSSGRAAASQQVGALRTAGGFGGSRMGAGSSGYRGTSTANRGYYQNTPYNQGTYNPYSYTPQAAAQPTPIGTATGTSFQQRLNNILNRAGGDEEEAEVLGNARIVPDERSNSLIVYANRQDMQMITNIVSKVDVLLAQVLIEGIVVAVALGDGQELGVSWYQTPKRFGGDFSGAGAVNNGFLGVLTNFPSATPSGFSYWGRLGEDINVAVQAMANDSKVRILQRPRIQTSHAVPGSFFSGSTVPYVTGFSDYGFGTGVSTRSSVQQIQVGVQLEVTPYITPDGLVVLDIYQDISQLGEYVQIDQNEVPTTTSRTASATLSVRDGETIMLGGYIEDNRTSSKSGVPLLKDIPGLGVLFRSSSKRNSRAELILLMKVTVLRTPQDASAYAEMERSMLPGLNSAQREFQASEGTTTRPPRNR